MFTARKLFVGAAGRNVVNQLAAGQVDGYKIVRRLGCVGVRCGVVLDAQLFRIRDNAGVPEVLIVVALEHKGIASVRERRLRHRSTQRRAAFARQWVHGVRAVPRDYERSLAFFLCAGETLIIVRVPGKERVGPDTDLLANCINLRQHFGACSVPARVVRIAGAYRNVGRMVEDDQQRALVFFLFDSSESGSGKSS